MQQAIWHGWDSPTSRPPLEPLPTALSTLHQRRCDGRWGTRQGHPSVGVYNRDHLAGAICRELLEVELIDLVGDTGVNI